MCLFCFIVPWWPWIMLIYLAYFKLMYCLKCLLTPGLSHKRSMTEIVCIVCVHMGTYTHVFKMLINPFLKKKKKLGENKCLHMKVSVYHLSRPTFYFTHFCNNKLCKYTLRVAYLIWICVSLSCCPRISLMSQYGYNNDPFDNYSWIVFASFFPLSWL